MQNLRFRRTSAARGTRAHVVSSRALRSNIELLERRTLLSTVVVNTLLDGVHPAGLVSLRDAVLKANATPSTTITFDPTLFATPKTITLDGNEMNLSGTSTIIKGPAAGVTISANNLRLIFSISQTASISLSGLTLTKAARGAVFNRGTLTIVHSSISGNNGSAGAGLYNTGTATLTDVTVSGNSSPSSTGGGIYNYTIGKITLTNVTVSGNSASDAAGIYNAGTATLTNVTVTGNTAAGTGGGVYNYKNSVMSLANVTISGNTATTGDGGGLFVFAPSTTTIANTIIAGNTLKSARTTPDVSGAVTSLGFNLIGKTDGSTGWTATDLTGTIAHPRAAGLGALANNGGPTLTLLPLTGSAVIDHGSNALIRPGSTTDQRGLARIGKAIVDIGAVEVQPPAGSIGGTVFADANANGKLDVGEKGIANVKVYLDANKNGLPDASEVSLLTDASGNFKFTNLAAGTFRVRQVLPAGNALIAPVAGFFDIPLVLGASSVGSLFADAPATASISGRVFGDSNANGLRDPGEIGLGLWKVYLDKNKNGALDAGEASTITDINGNWSFVGLLAGSYTVRIVPVAGDVATKPTGGVMTITLAVGQASINNLFGEKAIA